MRDWSDVRRIARRCRTASEPAASIDAALDAAFFLHGLTHRIITTMDGFGPNIFGAMQRVSRTIYTSPQLSAEHRRFVLAHELGHYLLHDDPGLELQTLTYADAPDTVEGYSERAFIEAQADIFADEFLCPLDGLQFALRRGLRPSPIAASLGLDLNLVLRQTTALLREPLSPPTVPKPRFSTASRELAADLKSNLLVSGLPRSGKTQICALRAVTLIEGGARPAGLLVASRDEAAARALRGSVLSLCGAAAQSWFGTIRGLALEIIRACPSRIGRSAKFIVLDDAGALRMAEAAVSMVPKSGKPVEPSTLLHLIKWCKRTNFAPPPCAGEDRAALQALMAAYEACLAAHDALDGCDLVRAGSQALTVPEVQAHVKAKYDHLIVDDFEELCLSEHLFVEALAAARVTVFATGHPLFSIYRHKGAQPDRLTLFERHYPRGTCVDLPGRPWLVQDARTAAGFTLSRSGASVKRTPNIEISVVATIEEEADLLARLIKSYSAQGIHPKNQVILAQTHRTLGTFASLLESRGIRTGHLGEFAERTEVGDLLAVIGVLIDNDCESLLRLGRLAIYDVSTTTISEVARVARERNTTLMSALKAILKEAPSERLYGLQRLWDNLEPIAHEPNAFIALSRWLFDESDYLQAAGAVCHLSATTAEAIALLLEVCDEQARLGGRGARDLLTRLRRIGSHDQEVRLGEQYERADTVQLMTVHASKGRHFDVAYIPKAIFGKPSSRGPRWGALLPDDCLTPYGHDEKMAEERALFAISLTRAKRLHLTRAHRYGKRTAHASLFVDELARQLAK